MMVLKYHVQKLMHVAIYAPNFNASPVNKFLKIGSRVIACKIFGNLYFITCTKNNFSKLIFSPSLYELNASKGNSSRF